jgi:V8-like Glu-specific endopeptidase
MGINAVTDDTPETLISEPFDEWTVGGGYLYWATNCQPTPPTAAEQQPQAPSSHYALHRWPIGGGTPETIITASHSNCNTFRFLAADGDGVFFWNDSQDRFEHYPSTRPPGQAVTVVRGSIVSVVPAGLHLDNNNLYYANSGGRIRRVAKDGSSNRTIHNTGSFVRSFAVDTGRDDIYWVDGNGLWYGRKNCSPTPCSSRRLTSITGDHIILGATGILPRTVYMVRNVSPPLIRGYDCQSGPCIERPWYSSDPTNVLEIGLPAWTRTGFAAPKDWLIFPERTTTIGRLRQMELDASPSAYNRDSGFRPISMKAMIEGSRIYYASLESGSERIMRLPLSGDAPLPNFGNLSQISNPHLSNAWKPIVRVASEWHANPNSIYLCTGTLIDPGIVITAGRCVYNSTLGAWADEVRVIPAYEDGSEPFGYASATNLWAFDEYTSGGSGNYNIGWIKLDRPVGALTGWHDIDWGDDQFVQLSIFNNPGYPRTGFNQEFMFNRSGRFTTVNTERLVHTAEVANMKGSPALNLQDLTVYAIESHTVSGTDSAYARLTQTKVAQIQGDIANNTPTAVDLVPLKFRMPVTGGLVAGTWPTSESFVLHNYSTASAASGHNVTLKAYLSAGDDTIEDTDTLLATGSFQIQGDLDGRKNFVVPNINWNGAPAIPLDTPPGDYSLGIILDEADAVPANNATHGWDTTSVQILPPQMSVTPNTLVANVDLGDPPITNTVTVDILGNGANNPDFNWSGTPSAGWLSITPTIGTDNQPVTVTIDGNGLTPGTYHGQVNFATDLLDGSGIPVASTSVSVTLNVGTGVAVWQPEPAVIHFDAIAGGANPPSQALLVKATIDYPFNWIVADGSPVTNDAPWLPVNSGAGTAPGLFNVIPDISGLAPGNYSTQLATYSPGEANYALTTVNLTVHAAGPSSPIVQVFPATLFFDATAGQPGPGPQTFSIANIGTGQLDWTASSDVAWLNLDQSGGSGGANVSVSVSVGGLSPGTHVGQITVDGGAGSQQVVRVVLQLRQPATMVIDGNYLVFNGLSGQASPSAQQFTVRNTGSGSFDWLSSENIDWLDVIPSQGVAPATPFVVPDTTGLNPCSLQGNVTITSPTALGSPQEIDVRLFLRQGPVLAVMPHVLDFDVVAGPSAGGQKSFNIANVSRGNMDWTAVSNANWLSLGQSAGVTGPFASTSVNVNVDAANLSPRDAPYVGQIAVRTSNGEGSPQTVTVFLHVASPARYCNIPNGGQGYVINSRNAKIRFTNVQRTLTADGGCDFSATLNASLPQNASLQSQVSGHVDSNNLFIPTSSSPLVLKVAVLTLQLSNNFSISDNTGLRAMGGQWKLPSKYGGRSSNFGGAIQINAGGISLEGGGKFDIPDIDFGAMQLRQLQGQVSVAADWNYLVALTGDLDIGVGGATSIKDIELRLDQRGFRSGQIGNFTISDIAGVELEVVSATFDSKKIQADRAILKIPQAWGGAEGALYGLAIDFNGNLTVTGGRFKLPSISAGGDRFKLSSLEGEFRSVPGGYEIQARGEFGMGGIGESGGGCTLIVDVTIFSDKNASVLVIDSLDGQHLADATTRYATANNLYGLEAAEAIGLRELTLGIWDCQPGLPIGPTGFELTGVQGTIKLRSSLEEVSLKVQIQSIAKLGPIPFISVEPKATFRPDPFFLGYQGPTFMTNIEVSNTIGKFENRRFSAEMVFDFTILHGGMGIEAGRTNSGSFYLSGNGWAELSVKKGSVFKKCKLGLCVNFPPFTLTPARAEAEVSLTHIYGSLTVLGHGVSFKYSFESGDIDLSLTQLAHVITSEDIRQVRAFRPTSQGSLPANHSQIAFTGSEDVLLTLPVASAGPQIDPAAAQLTTTVQSDVLFILVQPASGQLTFVLIDPSGQEYTPANLPENMQFEQAIVDGNQQIVYSVSGAQPGAWQTRVEGDVSGTNFAVFETANVGPAVLDNLALTPTGNLNEVEVQWQHLAQEATPSIKIYANALEITQTVSYTNANGVLVTGITDKFIGEPVATFSNPPTDGRVVTAVIDLNPLPSDRYAFWIEAEGIATPGVRCYISQSSSGCERPASSPAWFIVDHTTTFPSAWDPGLAGNVAIQDGLLHASWDASTHPDVDHYLLTARGEGVLRPGQETYAEISVPLVAGQSGRVTATMDNIEPGATYRLMIKAIDEDGGRNVESPELVVQTPQPDFHLTSPDMNATVRAGGAPRTVTVDLEMSSNLPYDPLLLVDYDRLPDGIYVEFGDESVAGRPTAQTTMSISVTMGLPPGHYVVPIVARSGELERMLNFSIELLPPQYVLYLPLVVR